MIAICLGLLSACGGQHPIRAVSAAESLSRKLQVAIESDNKEAVKRLIHNGVSLKHPLPNGCTPYVWATKTGNLSPLLEKMGSSPLDRDRQGRNALFYLAGTPHYFAVSAPVFSFQVQQPPQKVLLPIQLAQIRGQKVLGLIQHYRAVGGRLNIQDNEGSSSIHYAAKGGNLEVLQLLLRAGISPNIQNRAGQTPLMYLLEDRPTSLFDRDAYAARALYGLSSLDQVLMTTVLIRAGADVKLKDGKGKDAMEYAKLASPMVASLLEQLEIGP